ncbi:MAG: hypothetical protein QOD39_4118 [Mycobacterium sp.]|jgi:hypothetical protein|nr:hypothetical protein [Mycobacterium sp.]
MQVLGRWPMNWRQRGSARAPPALPEFDPLWSPLRLGVMPSASTADHTMIGWNSGAIGSATWAQGTVMTFRPRPN